MSDHPGTESPRAAADPDSYEFTEPQNTTIRGAAGALSFAGVTTLISAAVYAVGWAVYGRITTTAVAAQTGSRGANGPISVLILLALLILMGVWLVRAGGAMRRVTDTEGRDIPHMLEALTQVRNYFYLMRVLLIITLILLVLLFMLLASVGPGA